MASWTDKFSFDIAGRHISGKHTVFAIAAGVTFGAIYGVKNYFAGRSCTLQKDLTGKNIVVTGGADGLGKQTVRILLQFNANVYMGDVNSEKNW